MGATGVMVQEPGKELTEREAGQEMRKVIGWTAPQLKVLLGAVIPQNTPLAAVVQFAYICKRTGLDPFVRQIYLINYGGKPTAVTGIDGYRLTAVRSGTYAGSEAPRHEGMVREEVYIVKGEKQANGDWIDKVQEVVSIMRPTTTYVTVLKDLPGGRLGKFVGVADWNEFARYDVKEVTLEDGKRKRVKILRESWRNGPKNMNAKCAEAQGLRKMAPAELSGVYTDAELDVIIDVVGKPSEANATAKEQPQARLTQAAAASGGGEVKTAKDLWNRIMDYVGGNSEEAAKVLAKITAFQKDGRTISKSSIEGMSDVYAVKSWSRFKELYPGQA